uniref:Uncharacterized protein n=1 Tax=Oryzias latipes TaxID=8090 RepID=A0A3P9J0N1_ORYLA
MLNNSSQHIFRIFVEYPKSWSKNTQVFFFSPYQTTAESSPFGGSCVDEVRLFVHLWLSLSVLVSLHVSCCVCVCTMGLFCVCIHVFVGVFCMIRRLSPKLPWL